MWPNQAPFRRAARWDGVCPLSLNVEPDQMMPVDEVQAMLTTIRAQRASDAPLEVVISGATPGDDPARAAAILAPYASVGMTWWVESVHPMRGPFAAMRERIRQGPPRL